MPELNSTNNLELLIPESFAMGQNTINSLKQELGVKDGESIQLAYVKKNVDRFIDTTQQICAEVAIDMKLGMDYKTAKSAQLYNAGFPAGTNLDCPDPIKSQAKSAVCDGGKVPCTGDKQTAPATTPSGSIAQQHPAL